MTNSEINIVTYGNRNNVVGTVSFEACKVNDSAEPTSRCLSGTDDHWAAEEWAESVTLPDGRQATRYYLFRADSITDDAGEPLEAENYPWDANHCVRIELRP